MTNQVSISGVLVDKQPLRYTPAGIPLLSFVIRHQSEQSEAGMRRQVMCEIAVMALADWALKAEKIAEGTRLNVSGFIAKRSMKSTQLVLHVNRIEH